jgi:hypothetical protein
MEHPHKAAVVFGAGARLVTIRFETDPPAAIYIGITAAQSFNTLLPAEQPVHPWGNYEWMPNPYARRYTYPRVISPSETIHSLVPVLKF